MKRKFLLLLAICAMLVALALALSACDSDTADSGETTTTTSTGGTINQTSSITRIYLVDGDPIGSQTISESDISAPYIAVPEREHYNGKWEMSFVDARVMYYNAVYTPKQYSVTFIADDNVVGIKTYTIESKNIIPPVVPSKQYYKNGRWESYSLNGGNKTVNAIYTPVEYTVTFVANGATVDVQTYTVEDKNITIPAIPELSFGYYGEGQSCWESYTLDGGNKTVCAITNAKTQAKYTLDGSYYYVSGYNKIIDGKIEILSEYNGVPVSRIESSAFRECSELTSVTIQQGVTQILSYAFYKCVNLKTVDIPPSVTDIWDSAFFECKRLNNITFGENSRLEWIGDSAFNSCYNLTSITIPSNVSFIGDGAFFACYKLVEVYNLSNFSKPVGYALNTYSSSSGKSKLFLDENGFFIYDNGSEKMLIGYKGDDSNITIPEEITKIYKYAFLYCDTLKSITIPSNVSSIGYGAFSACTNLSSATFENANGWGYSYSENDPIEIEFSRSDLSVKSRAARYLTTYYDCYWKRI